MEVSFTVPAKEQYRQRAAFYTAYQKAWKAAHPEYREKVNARFRATHRANREKALALYGGKCLCCGESRYEFIAIDHIHGGGTQERKKKFPNSQSFYKYISVTYLPEVYRILCHNCNSAMGYYGYCPHNKEVEKSI